jgi:hypothetical protein
MPDQPAPGVTKPCKGCGKMILWAQTTEGKWIPLDTRAPTYSIADVKGMGLRALRSEGYVSHFATCPKANDFSASKKEPAGA